ncbi:TPA: peptide chain release factor 1 [candidate division WOR-3 bacterium]|jgi:peptide chain release factor 1|uniref:Peptide chain release factor 1 n=1 Tax=candidate division WOR-3 bacterium TaxID=2052148 RepID=A0A350H9H8_UNCW3|nr:peptide chain release factor 1 [candidate division WOR-3 bacterium]
MNNELLNIKLDEYMQMEQLLSDPKTANDTKKYKEISKKYSEMTLLAEKIRQIFNVRKSIDENSELLKTEKDSEMKGLITDETKQLKMLEETILSEIKVLLIPKDPNDDRNVLFEIRAGTGGEEAALFAAVLFRMYKKYAENKGFAVEQIDFHPTELGGFKEMIFGIKGKNAYGTFKFESGVHRVQRVPTTENSGRIHTSAVTVAVLPEVEDVELDIAEKEFKIDIFHASGAGGQNVNKVATAVRITHLPTNTVVVCQDERSQHKNREKAMRIMKARLYEQKVKEQQAEISKSRKDLVGTGDRSERIRTYNYPERRVTDHRIPITLYRLEAIVDGDLDDLVIPLRDEDNKRKLMELA